MDGDGATSTFEMVSGRNQHSSIYYSSIEYCAIGIERSPRTT